MEYIFEFQLDDTSSARYQVSHSNTKEGEAFAEKDFEAFCKAHRFQPINAFRAKMYTSDYLMERSNHYDQT